MDLAKPIAFSVHAREKMLDRGATEGGIMTAIRTGSPEPARKGRLMFRKNFPFSDQWRGKRSAVRQVAPVVTEAAGRLVGVTVFVFSF